MVCAHLPLPPWTRLAWHAWLAHAQVKKELPEATVRFATIDKEVKEVLKSFKEIKNCVDCCNRDGLMKFLEKQQGELEICEKALADYMESKRRAFPRWVRGSHTMSV